MEHFGLPNFWAGYATVTALVLVNSVAS